MRLKVIFRLIFRQVLDVDSGVNGQYGGLGPILQTTDASATVALARDGYFTRDLVFTWFL